MTRLMIYNLSMESLKKMQIETSPIVTCIKMSSFCTYSRCSIYVPRPLVACFEKDFWDSMFYKRSQTNIFYTISFR